MILLLKPLEYYKEKYGSYTYALDRLYLLMEKQHNRGQEAAGVGVVKMHANPGSEYFDRERALGTAAIDEIFEKIGSKIPDGINSLDADYVDVNVPFIGQTYMGHLRYSTTGRSGLSYAHPFLRRNNWRSRALMLCGNFNMTNVQKLFDKIVSTGQHPRLNSDTIVLLEQIGYALDKENHRLYRELRDRLEDPELAVEMENKLDMAQVLASTAPGWDGGFVICGATGPGDMFALQCLMCISERYTSYSPVRLFWLVRIIMSKFNRYLPKEKIIVAHSSASTSLVVVMLISIKSERLLVAIWQMRSCDVLIMIWRTQCSRSFLTPQRSHLLVWLTV
jgi:amidophosphoribosyltransferase